MKKLFAIILTIAVAVTFTLPVWAAEDIEKEEPLDNVFKCGKHCYYTIDEAGNVDVFGSGAIEDSFFYDREDVVTVNICNGITEIGYDAFGKCENLKSVTLPSTVTAIEGCAFIDCPSMKMFTVPASVKKIGAFAIGMEFKYVHVDPDVDPRFRPVGAWFAPYEDFVIFCYRGTEGERYAKYHQIKHVVSKPNFYKFKYKLSRSTFVYDGKKHKPVVYVSLGSQASKANYMVKYQNKKSINPGEYQIRVTVMGHDYNQEKILTYKIIPKATALKSAHIRKDGAIKVKWKKGKGKLSGYELKLGKKIKVVKGQKKTAAVIKGIKNGKGKKIKIRTYYEANGKAVYSKWSKGLSL